VSDCKIQKNKIKDIKILFITSFFVTKPDEIREGIGHRYAGLYGNFTRKYNYKYKIYWYAIKEQTLFIFNPKLETRKKVRISLPKAIWALSKNKDKKFVVCMAYPYSLGWLGKNNHLFIKNLPKTISSLTLLLFLQLRKKCSIILDVFDLPLETSISYNYIGLNNLLFTIIVTISLLIEFILMKSCNVILLSNYYVKILSRRYFLSNRNLHIIPSGSFPQIISPIPPKKTSKIDLLYSGSALESNGFKNLVDCVELIRDKGYDINLVHSGPVYIRIENKNWFKHIDSPKWLDYLENTLQKCDICVVPYPPKGHWNFGHLAKVFDYMAAGKPVLSMNLAETGRIIKKYKCGLTANNWKEFYKNIVLVSKNSELAVRLGRNGRSAVKEFFDYNINSEKLDVVINKIIQNNKQ
jgi:glycosyltransferase involved in cell wall biosynthesis